MECFVGKVVDIFCLGDVVPCVWVVFPEPGRVVVVRDTSCAGKMDGEAGSGAFAKTGEDCASAVFVVDIACVYMVLKGPEEYEVE